MAIPLKEKPARDYPNINGLQGMRLYWNATPPDAPGPFNVFSPGVLLRPNVPVPIGTLPAAAFVLSMGGQVKTAADAGATLDLGTKAQPTKFFAALPLDAVAGNDVQPANLGVLGDGSTVIVATLKGVSAPLTMGIFSLLLTYYAKID